MAEVLVTHYSVVTVVDVVMVDVVAVAAAEVVADDNPQIYCSSSSINEIIAQKGVWSNYSKK